MLGQRQHANRRQEEGSATTPEGGGSGIYMPPKCSIQTPRQMILRGFLHKRRSASLYISVVDFLDLWEQTTSTCVPQQREAAHGVQIATSHHANEGDNVVHRRPGLRLDAYGGVGRRPTSAERERQRGRERDGEGKSASSIVTKKRQKKSGRGEENGCERSCGREQARWGASSLEERPCS